MISNPKSTDDWFTEMQNKGLASTANYWLERAILEKNPALSVGIANSRLLVYDRLDRCVVFLSQAN
jgi:hypothetical protein